jgi:hypothetical protein
MRTLASTVSLAVVTDAGDQQLVHHMGDYHRAILTKMSGEPSLKLAESLIK